MPQSQQPEEEIVKTVKPETMEEMLMKKIPAFTSQTVMRKRKIAPQSQQPAEEIAKTDAPKVKEETLTQKMPAEKNSKKVSSPQKAFLDVFGQLTNRHRSWDVWRDFITMFACSLSNPLDKEHRYKREKLYSQIVKKYNKQEQELFPELAAQTVLALEENPEQDFLGSIFMSLNLGNEHNGQFFTPYDVCKMMAEVTMDGVLLKVERDGYISINDPCCGAGATLIAGIHVAKKHLDKANLNYQNHILVVAQDIDEVVALMCYIQLSLLGVAGYVKVGNSLTDPITGTDDKENYWFTPMYFSNIWMLRRIFGRC
jgi:hypothetical protein